jgi:ribonucleoside-diphosphate reductase alpha chain
MTTSDILNMMIKSATDLVSIENTSWEFIAGRLLMISLYKKAAGNRGVKIRNLYKKGSYKALMDDYIESGLYYKDYYNYYSEQDILDAGKYIDADRDFDYNHTTVTMYAKRYLLNPNGIVKELPQEMYMSAALFLATPETSENRLEVAFKIYDACSQ